MAQNKIVRFGPTSITNVATNMAYPGTRDGSTRAAVGWSPTGDLYLIIKHVRIVNSSGSPVTVNFGIGTTAVTPTATNTVIGFGLSIPANSYVDWYGSIRLDGTVNTEYLTGLASTTAVCTFQGEGEVGIV